MDADSLLDELWEVAGPEGGAGEQEADSASSGAGRGAAEPQLDYDLAPSQVAARIESCALWVAEHLAAGRLPDLDLPAAPPAPPQARSLAGRHPESADRYSRLWAVLAACHQGLVAGARATQRELHYRLKPLDVFTQPGHAAEAVQDACALLRVPRSALGVTTSSKGLVAGRLRIRDRATGAVTQCWGPGAEGGRPIGGDLDAIACMELDACDAAAVLVVEKDAVFQQLVAEDFHIRHLPAILVTGKGVPDLPTRCARAARRARRRSLRAGSRDA
jgi:meiotic recombination protein SPO11